MVQKFGIEGLLNIDESQKNKVRIETNMEKEEAEIIDKR